MKKNKDDRLPMIDEPMILDPQDWVKTIREEIQHIRQAHSKVTNKNKRITTALLDLDHSMEKRRIKALINSLNSLDEHRRKFAGEWINLNIFCESYADLLYNGHLLTAASIWILDKLTGLNISFDEIYPLLPQDENLLDDFYDFDFWDSQYKEELIASVKYVLHCRNIDIAPLENDGRNGERALTSNLAAEGKDHADVPSRRAFEALLEFLPQQMKDEAVKHFKDCLEVWTNRYFAGVEYLRSEYLEKQDAINAVRREINEIHDKVEDKADNLIAERRKKKNANKAITKNAVNKQPVNAPFLNPNQMKTDFPVPSRTNSLFSEKNISSVFNENVGNFGLSAKLGMEIKTYIDKLSELDDLHDKAAAELEDSLDKRSKFLYYMGHRGYITASLYQEFFDGNIPDVVKPLPITDPYELCFALLYLVETGSDIPWLYGSCIGMMSEVADHLPWGLYDYDELDDQYWADIPPTSGKQPDFPDWYQRGYVGKGDNEYDARSLAQIVYETTGCLMPRDLHRYDAELKNLGKYGIRQNKAIAILYCMLALGNSRRRISANNLKPAYMKFISDQDTDFFDDEKQVPQDWKTQKTALEKEIHQLRSALHSAEKSAEDARKGLENQQRIAEAEHRELADLREIIFNKEELDNYDADSPENIDDSQYPYAVQKSTVVFGGHETWVKALKPMLKGNIKFIAKEMKIDVSLVRYADVVWIQTNAIPHRSYNSIVNTARKLGKPIRYFTNASAAKCAEQIVENDKRGG